MKTAGLRLSEMEPGTKGRVLGYDSPSKPYLRRLLAMGLVPGAEFTVVRRAPLGDPVEISVLGFLLSLRADEAAGVRIEAAS